MEIGVPGADAMNPMFPHQHRGCDIVKKVAGDMRQLGAHRVEHGAMTLGGNQQCEPGRGLNSGPGTPTPSRRTMVPAGLSDG